MCMVCVSEGVLCVLCVHVCMHEGVGVVVCVCKVFK